MKIQDSGIWTKTKKGEKKLCIEVINMWHTTDLERLIIGKRSLIFYVDITENLGNGKFLSKPVMADDVPKEVIHIIENLGYRIL